MIPTRPDVHVLDPLSPAEIERAAELVRDSGRFAAGSRFILISTAEPPRGSRERQGRAAEAIAFDPARQVVSEFHVDLERDVVVAVTERDDVRPAIGLAEVEGFEQAVRSHAGFREAMRRRGIDDLASVIIDPAPSGPTGARGGGGRPARAPARLRPALGRRQRRTRARSRASTASSTSTPAMLVHFEDRGIVPFPAEEGEFRERARRAARRRAADPHHAARGPELRRRRLPGPLAEVAAARRLHEPRGPGPARGRLRGRRRRAADPAPRVDRRDGRALRATPTAVLPRTPLDIGELGIGTMTNSLTLGCDCLGEIHYFDVAYVDRRRRRGRDDPATRSACTRRTTGSSGSTSTSGPARSRCAAAAGW